MPPIRTQVRVSKGRADAFRTRIQSEEVHCERRDCFILIEPVRSVEEMLTTHWSRRLPACAALPLPGACDQEVSKRTLATRQKVWEEVSPQETRNHGAPG